MTWLKRLWDILTEGYPLPLISSDKAREIADAVRAEHGQKTMSWYSVRRNGDYWVVQSLARPPDVFIIHRNTGEVKEYNLIQKSPDLE